MRRRSYSHHVGIIAAACGLFQVLYGPALGQVPDAYRTMWNAPQLQQRINDGIEKHRKGDAVLVVTGADGKPVAGTEVAVKQLTHAFLLGCNCFFLKHFKDQSKNEAYERRFARLFNFASAPFYWSDLEPVQGKPRFAKDSPFVYRRPPPDLCVEFARKHGLTLKGHPLMWEHFYPKWLGRDKGRVGELLSKRMAQIAARYARSIKIWDVVNETIVPKRVNVVPDDYVAWCFQEANRWFGPDNVLMSNETKKVAHKYLGPDGRQSPYYKLLATLKRRGVRFDAIGFQFHIPDTGRVMACTESAPELLFKVYDLYGGFGKPLFITEVSIGSAGTGAEAQAVQAEIARNFYRLFFSVEHMAGVTWWNLGDGMAHKWEGGSDENKWQAGLLGKDLQPKEAYRVLDRLINHEWKTSATGRTDANGRFEFRRFCGTYEVKVRLGDALKTFKVNVSKRSNVRHELRLKN